MTDLTPPPQLWTIGHGNRSIAEFIALLDAAAIRCLVDVRAYPASRRHPHFARAALQRSLQEAGVRYDWEGEALGGRRQSIGDSPHVALRNPQFRAYADHMATPAFREALGHLIDAACKERTAIMCAERLPSECHRGLISDMLAARGVTVEHLVAAGDIRRHQLATAARRAGDTLVYDGGEQFRLKL